jgi:hypothetical protein
MTEGFQVPYWDVASVWARVAPHLQRAIDLQDEWTLDAVYRKLTNPYEPMPMQLWVQPWTSAAVTQIQTHPSGIRKCLLFLCGGSDVESLKANLQKVEAWAKSLGCSKTIIYGRIGWSRALPDYHRTTSIMEKTL